MKNCFKNKNKTFKPQVIVQLTLRPHKGVGFTLKSNLELNIVAFIMIYKLTSA